MTKGSKLMWMISLADLLGLMLAFFVMQFAMTGVDFKNWKKIKSSVESVFEPSPYSREDLSGVKPLSSYSLQHSITDLVYLEQVVGGHIQSDLALEGMRVERKGGRLAIIVPLSKLFDEGNKALSLQGLSLAFYLGNIFYPLNNKIECLVLIPEVYQADARFQHQWEMSLTRALTIADELKKAGYRYNIPVFGKVAAAKGLSNGDSGKNVDSAAVMMIIVYPDKA